MPALHSHFDVRRRKTSEMPTWNSHFDGQRIKVAEHSFQVPMPNTPLLLNYFCFGVRFLQEPILASEVFILAFWLGCVLLPWQQGLKNGFCLFAKNPVVRLFSLFAHYELTLNPFCQHYSNNIMT